MGGGVPEVSPTPGVTGTRCWSPGQGCRAPVPSQEGLGSTEGVSPLSAVDGPPMQRSRHVSLLPKPLTKMGFDEVSAQWIPPVSPCPSLWLYPSMAKPAMGFGQAPCPPSCGGWAGCVPPHDNIPPRWGSPLPPQIFLINLVRRPDRRQRMLASLRELEIAPRVVDAVDGR